MSFLAQLADQVSTQIGTIENQAEGVIDGSNNQYSSLGDLSQRFDKSAQRSYVEEGYLRTDPYTTIPKQFEILMQEPNATVLIKKRMFSSVGDNYRPDYMSDNEKLYYKATKILFQNKCNQISALEKLSKIAKITQAVGNVSEQFIPLIITLTDQLNYGGPTNDMPTSSGLFGSLPDSNPYQTSKISQFTQVIDKLRKVYAFSTTAHTTTWLVDALNLFQSNLGQGTGVIEITNFTNVSTSTTLDMEPGGSFSLTISDPYESMVITDYDIEIALSDATNTFYNHKLFQFGTQAANNVIQSTTAQLAAARQARNASPIEIMQSPSTLIGQPVTVIVNGQELVFTYNTLNGIVPGLGGSGGAVSVGPEYLQGGAILGFDGLSTSNNPSIPGTNVSALSPQSELSLFQALIAAIYNQNLMTNSSQNNFVVNNDSTNYARRKMRFNYTGQLIIQPMDVAHIYMSSKSRYDSKVLAGLNNMMSGAGILQNINNTTSDFLNTFSTIFQPANSIPLQLEKATYVGPTFPNYLWSMLRTQFVTEKEGTHVFAGVVDNASDTWSDGHFTIDVRGRDQSVYFEQGKVNFKPGADTFNGAWFDPMTPFQTNFDTVTADYKNDTPQLLPENIALLSSGSAGAATVRKKLGPWAGTPGTAANIIDDRTTDPLTGKITKTFYAPDGLVYVWREGIGIFTQAGLSSDVNDPSRVGSLNVFQEPFAGQDIMNVISLLITGIPYNYTTFYQGVLGNGKFGADQQSGQNPAFAFINSLNQQLSKSNTLWGNFIPFKSLSVDEKTYAMAQFNQFQITKNNSLLDTQIRQLQTLQQQSLLYTSIKNYAPNLATTDPSFNNLQSQIDNLSSNINTTVSNIKTQNNQYYSQAGNDPSFNTSDFISSAASNQVQDPQLRQQLRRQINYITRRMSYDVRANQDRNLFIVDDAYDKDYDILAFEQSINNNMKPWNNEFLSVKEKITSVAKLLNLEVFCDTQGHVRARPPQYNRMPSSVFYRMLYLKQALHVQVFPDYMNQLFTDQIQGLKTQVEVLEDEIRLDCDILAIAQNLTTNVSTDQVALSFIQSGNANSSGNAASATSGTGAPFNFLSARSSGEISDINSLIQQANPDVVQSQQNTSLTPPTPPPDTQSILNTLQNQASTKQIFTNVTRVAAIQSAVAAQTQALSGYATASATITNNTDANMLIQRIQTKSGQQLSISDYIQSTNAGISYIQLPTNQSVDVFKLTADLQDKISKRQQAVKLLYSTIKNSTELKSLDNSTSTSNQYSTPNGYGNSHVPEVFANMIEDETYDDYGPGSGSRYIIRRPQIKNIQISANPPPYTSIEVSGILSPFLADPSTLPQALNFFPGSGNGLVTAMAIDYDMWRTYGFKQQASIAVPFLNDPQKQCGPYAAMLLSVARKNIFRGSITIVGNEYMQPGEVVFLEDRGMLFYVNSVRHNFTFASGFTTTLELSYGHTPGEYIPTSVDFIGKMIYKNGYDGNIVVQRQDNSGNELNLAAFTLGPNYPSNPNGTSQAVNTGAANQTPNPTSEFNSQAMNNMLYTAAYTINKNNSSGNGVVASIEIRTYSNSNTPNSNITQFAQTLQQQISGMADGPKNSSSATSPNPNSPLPSGSVKVVNVNMSDPTNTHSPSQKAWDLARNQVTNSSTGGASPTNNAALQNALFSYIVDVWVVNNPVANTTTPSTGTSATNPNTGVNGT
jgi:hypothetical protein